MRLDRGLSQADVAKVLHVTPDTVTGWELNRHEPPPKSAALIISFLGYFPFTSDDLSLGKQLHYARLIAGKTQRQAAKEIGCDESTLRLIELDQSKPQPGTQLKIQDFINDTLRF